MKPAPPVTRIRFGMLTAPTMPSPGGGGHRDATKAASGGGGRRDGRAPLPGAACRSAGGADRNAVRSLAGTGAAGGAGRVRFHLRAHLAIPVAAGQWAAAAA